jgi:tripartite-type tricarboxylate transporter receptor subunit TctC
MKAHRSMWRLWFVTGLILSGVSLNALAQWPTKPVRLMVTQAAGSATDTVSRYYADKVGKAIGQQIIVENRPGGANIPGMVAAARAPADGYNFLIGTSVSFTTNVYLFKALPYDPINDFVPVAMLARPGFTVAVNAKLPAKNLTELAAYARARPGKLTFAVDSHRNLNGIIAAYLNKVMGTDITLIPYTSTVQGMQDTAAGTTDAFIQTYGLMQGFVKKGDLRPIAVTSATRASLQPDVATVAETYPGFQMTGWIAWFAPANTPVEILQRINNELNRIINDPETRDWAERYFTPVDPAGAGTLAGLREFVRTEMSVWGKAIEVVGLKAE